MAGIEDLRYRASGEKLSELDTNRILSSGIEVGGSYFNAFPSRGLPSPREQWRYYQETIEFTEEGPVDIYPGDMELYKRIVKTLFQEGWRQAKAESDDQKREQNKAEREPHDFPDDALDDDLSTHDSDHDAFLFLQASIDKVARSWAKDQDPEDEPSAMTEAIVSDFESQFTGTLSPGQRVEVYDWVRKKLNEKVDYWRGVEAKGGEERKTTTVFDDTDDKKEAVRDRRTLLAPYLPQAAGSDVFNEQNDEESCTLKAANLMMGMLGDTNVLGNAATNPLQRGLAVQRGLRYSGQLYAMPPKFFGGTLDKAEQYGTQHDSYPQIQSPRPSRLMKSSVFAKF